MMRAMQVFVWREGLRFFRQKGRLLATIMTPLVFWMMMGHGFGSLFEQTYLKMDSLTFFFPGILLMTLLFSSVFSMISVIEDRNEGFLQGVMLVPHAPTKIVLGKVAAASLWALIQAYFVLAFAPLIGLGLTFSMVVQITVILLLNAFFLSLLGFFFAWYLNSVQGFHSMMNIVLLPLWVLSGAVFPVDSASAGMKILIKANPLHLAIEMLQEVFYVQYSFPNLLQNVGFWVMSMVYLALILLLYFVCVYLVGRKGSSKSGR